MRRIPLDVGHAIPARRLVVRDGERLSLTTREAELLAYLVRESPRSVSVAELLEEVCGLLPTTETHTVQTTVYTLRRKIERTPAHPRHLILSGRKAYTFVWAEPEPVRTALESAELLAGIDSMAATAVLESVLGALPTLVAADRVALRVALGRIYQRQGRLDAAAAAVADLGGASPVVAGQGRVVRGLVLYRRGDRVGADAAWSRARDQVTGDASAERLWEFNRTVPRWRDPEVLDLWGRMSAGLAPRAATLVRSACAQGWLALGQVERALEVAVEVSGPHPYELRVLREVRALALVELGRGDEARRVWASASAADPAARRLEEPYGWGVRAAYLERTRGDAADRAWRRVSSLCPFSAQIGAALAR